MYWHRFWFSNIPTDERERIGVMWECSPELWSSIPLTNPTSGIISGQLCSIVEDGRDETACEEMS
jgi:hypothetical protein